MDREEMWVSMCACVCIDAVDMGRQGALSGWGGGWIAVSLNPFHYHNEKTQNEIGCEP